MNQDAIYIHGYGAVTTAGPDPQSFYQACLSQADLPVEMREYSLNSTPATYPGRSIDVKALRKTLPRHPRLRRSSSVTKFCTAATLQTIPAQRQEEIKNQEWRLGIILTFMNGCVNYSCRFYDEVLEEPAHASPLIFPETVFNAPASHIASNLESDGPCYTLVGDSATWFSALQTAQDWLLSDQVDGCLVLSGEELDQLTSEALSLYSRQLIPTEGAAAIYLEKEPAPIQLAELHGPFSYHTAEQRQKAIQAAWEKLTHEGYLIDGLTGIDRADRDEQSVSPEWNGPRISPARTIGEGMGVKAGLQTIAALQALEEGASRASVLACGGNQHAFSAVFSK